MLNATQRRDDPFVFGHSIVLLRSRLDSANDVGLHRPVVELNGCALPSSQIDFNPENRDFAALVQLLPGNNRVKLLFNDTVLKLTLRYELSDPRRPFVRLLLALPADADPFNSSVRDMLTRISMGARLLQTFFAFNLHGSSFALESVCSTSSSDADSHNIARLLLLSLCKNDLASIFGKDLYWHIVQDLVRSDLWDTNAVYLIFIGWTVATQCDKHKLIGYDNLGGGRVALVHGGCLFSWPEHISRVFDGFRNTDAIPQDMLDDSAGRHTVGGCFATSLGSALHELGHAFGLAHTKSGVMSRGFDNLHLSFLACQANVAENAPLSTFFEPSCRLILAHHSWIRDFCEANLPSDDISKSETNVYASTSGFVLIEIRQSDSVLTFWDLSTYRPKLWTLPDFIVQQDLSDCCLFFMSFSGCYKTFPICE